MKKNGWMILSVAMLAVTLVARADGQTETAPAKPAAEKPAKKEKKTKAAAEAKPAATTAEKPVILLPGAATMAGKNINVRGKASFKGEIVTKLQNGDAVNVIEQVILSKPKAGEPSQWAKISYPTNAHVWVHSSYLNADKTVKPKKLNIRTGAGENYSIVGTIEQGTTVKEVSTKGSWTEIEVPADAFAFVAASYVHQDGTSATVPQVVSVQPPEATPSTVTTDPIVAPATTDLANTNPAVEPTPTVADSANVPPPVVEEVWVPRTVSHEGIVKATVSIQAPTKYGLHAVDTGKLINYLYSPTAQLEMSRYAGKHIIVSGEEGLDERWLNTPVLTIQKIYVVK
ncbi:MAG: SH3 domain-containing protein [Verrucomicrobiota bacterium]